MKSRITLLTLSFLCACFIGHSTPVDSTASNDSTSEAKARAVLPYQITFITPLGTNGIQSHQSTNYMSFNLVAGYNGGLEGLEVGGFSNVLTLDARGTQIAGFANMVKGDLEGIQIAGFGNMVGGSSSGIQIGGFTNHAQQSGKLIQIGGFSNQVMGTATGGQISGFGNYVQDSLQGFQISGFGNSCGEACEGAQISGFMNNSGGDVKGGQVAGFANAAEDLEGVQIAGFLNKADTVSGFQIGFINVADTFNSGFPIGFVSNVKNGYRSFSFGANELQWITGDFHIGMDRFYNILSLSIGPNPDNTSWAFGYGLGSKVLNRTKSKIAVEMMAYHVNEREIWSNANNLLLRFQPKYEYYPKGGRFGLWAGPSANLLISGRWDGRGDAFESEIAPYEVLDDQGTYNNYRFWVGGQVGIKF